MNEILSNNVYFGIALTFAAYFIAEFIQKKSKLDILNPILVASALIIAFLYFTKIDVAAYNIGGDWLTLLLKPATVSLAIPLYKQLPTIRKNLPAILIGTLSGSVASMVCVTISSKLLSIPPELFSSILPKSITTAIGIEVSAELGGIPAVSAVLIAITGIIGATFAPLLFKLFKITDPLAKGLSLGTSSHAIGTAKALEIGETEGAASSVAIVCAGIVTVILAPLFARTY